MDRDYEAKYHALEDRHWWFRARRNLVLWLVLQLSPARSSRILEIGCSSGALMRQLKNEGYESVVGIDVSEEAIAECGRRGVANTRVMDAQQLDFPDASFDVITASDVLEHLADDALALRDWHRVLKPGGVMIVFVPAFPILWSEHDVANHHFRRYRRSELVRRATAAGFLVERRSYWNSTLFLPIAAVRGAKHSLPRREKKSVPDSDLFPPPAPVNAALFTLLSAENGLFRAGLNFPFGVSAMIVARKPCTASGA
jgi:SAM-dependent methyltransferase